MGRGAKKRGWGLAIPPQPPGNQDQKPEPIPPTTQLLIVHWGKIGNFSKGAFRLQIRHINYNFNITNVIKQQFKTINLFKGAQDYYKVSWQ